MRQQVDQKYTAIFSKEILIETKLTISDLKIMCSHLHHERGQLIQSCLFNPFNNNKIHFLFHNNTSKRPVLFVYSHYVPLIFYFFQNNAKRSKLPSHSTNNLKHKKPCGQSSIKIFYKELLEKKVKLNMVTSTVANKYVAFRSFGSSSIVCCSEKSSVITKSFKSYSDLVSSSLEVKVLKKFLLMN